MGNGILGPYIFMCYDKKFQRSTTNICFGASILVFAPQVYIELPLGSSRRELHFWEMGYWVLIYSCAMIKKFQRSTTNICFGASILVLAPQVYIELPVGSSRRELHFWEMGYWVLIYSCAMIKNFRGLRPIFALALPF